LRHGLTAETVIDGSRDSEDYRAFEAVVVADCDAQTAVERELVLRLASLLWRLRRIISIETDLFRIQSDIARERRATFCRAPAEPKHGSGSNMGSPSLVFDPQQEDRADGEDQASLRCALPTSARELTCCFLRLSKVDNDAFDRLGRYNTALWKQTAQTLLLLHSIRRF
jgi:hypothetical protein